MTGLNERLGDYALNENRRKFKERYWTEIHLRELFRVAALGRCLAK